jgi:hypothetical protein
MVRVMVRVMVGDGEGDDGVSVMDDDGVMGDV